MIREYRSRNHQDTQQPLDAQVVQQRIATLVDQGLTQIEKNGGITFTQEQFQATLHVVRDLRTLRDAFCAEGAEQRDAFVLAEAEKICRAALRKVDAFKESEATHPDKGERLRRLMRVYNTAVSLMQECAAAQGNDTRAGGEVYKQTWDVLTAMDDVGGVPERREEGNNILKARAINNEMAEMLHAQRARIVEEYEGPFDMFSEDDLSAWLDILEGRQVDSWGSQGGERKTALLVRLYDRFKESSLVRRRVEKMLNDSPRIARDGQEYYRFLAYYQEAA